MLTIEALPKEILVEILAIYHASQLLPDNVRYFGAFLDPPIYPKIGHHLWTFPKLTIFDPLPLLCHVFTK